MTRDPLKQHLTGDGFQFAHNLRQSTVAFEQKQPKWRITFLQVNSIYLSPYLKYSIEFNSFCPQINMVAMENFAIAMTKMPIFHMKCLI